MAGTSSKQQRRMLVRVHRAELAGIIVDPGRAEVVDWNGAFEAAYGSPTRRLYDLVDAKDGPRLHSLVKTTSMGNLHGPAELPLTSEGGDHLQSLVFGLPAWEEGRPGEVLLVCRPFRDRPSRSGQTSV